MKIFSLLVDWIWRGLLAIPPYGKLRRSTACLSFKGEDFYLNDSVRRKKEEAIIHN
ncbi:MAG: hypothetical protein F6K25_06275 [Okeania sp. SIO2G4]|uniref:hypothetical protein n=1 Tax=unclassified Okeania TaxID=2634635 RepID=UPI0013BC4DFA|nr:MULTISPECIES: hypothetical protein [unclassified Okeania]NEP07178.1 hypothetical protein [Okeania sp. SIO4D6]NEP41368.1 hypothetical protein [Okeania sp. SIO2H7]NEP70489.1 hypothetical protein [Okeania sp. SIO2G5]NEP92691.1 hypothetical protein [Okeania sp. SIO2F5]NEQ90351.1 hypothetical protein [Okeania sp. SIO2G4]